MNRFIFAFFLVFISLSVNAQTYSWKSDEMDGSRTGCISPSRDNVHEALGAFKGKTYISPNGRRFDSSSATAAVARIVIDAQDEMSKVKDVIAYSSDNMLKAYPESSLTNWYIDLFMKEVEKLAGKKVHIGVGNFGGIRVDMPKGEVILDDIPNEPHDMPVDAVVTEKMVYRWRR